VCGPHVFKVHKNIICCQSDYFLAAASSGRFAVRALASVMLRDGVLTSDQEGEEGKITLKAIGSEDGDETCDDPEAIKHVVNFFYHLDYVVNPATTSTPAPPVPEVLANPPNGLRTPARKLPAKKGKKRPRQSSSTTESAKAAAEVDADDMVMHAKVFAAAVKYQVSALQTLSAVKFTAAVQTRWDDDTFAEAARVVYTTTPEDVSVLRESVLDALQQHTSLLEKAGVEAVMREIGGLSFDFVKRQNKAPVARAPDPVRECMYHSINLTDCGYCGTRYCGECTDSWCPSCP